jgi:hypothetical protein
LFGEVVRRWCALRERRRGREAGCHWRRSGRRMRARNSIEGRGLRVWQTACRRSGRARCRWV